MSKSKTPMTLMTDLYPGRKQDLWFAAGSGKVYQGYKYGSGRFYSFCQRDSQLGPLRGTITAEKEEDISPVRPPPASSAWPRSAKLRRRPNDGLRKDL